MIILPKWKLFIWKILHNGIATKVDLDRRGIHVSLFCDLCDNQEEDAQHIFRFCGIAKQSWRGEVLSLHLEYNDSMSFKEWFMFYIRQFHSQDGKNSHRTVYFISTLWALWLVRRNRVFRGETTSFSVVQVLITQGIEQNGILHHHAHPLLRFLYLSRGRSRVSAMIFQSNHHWQGERRGIQP